MAGGWWLVVVLLQILCWWLLLPAVQCSGGWWGGGGGGNGAIRAHWTALASVVNTKQDINIQGRMEEENLQTLINSFIFYIMMSF